MYAYELMCHPNGELSEALRLAGVPTIEIDEAMAAWAEAAGTPVNAENEAVFVVSAQIVARARWDTLYPTGGSTIMFLTQPLINELVLLAASNPGAHFDFSAQETLPICVTIHPKAPAVVHRDVTSVQLSADLSGDCCHYAGMTP
jgi:hypothetical protein